jgi:arginase
LSEVITYMQELQRQDSLKSTDSLIPTANLAARVIRVIGVPLDLGASRRGVGLAPEALRVAGLKTRLESLGYDVEDDGDVRVEKPLPNSGSDPKARYLREIAITCVRNAEKVADALRVGRLPLVLGGDHSVAVGTVTGVADFYRRQGQRIGLIWIDAHADINTPDTSPSGNVHGMPLGALLGIGPIELSNIFDFSPKIRAENCALVGVRDVDRTENANLQRAGIHVFTMRDIDERGIRAVMTEALQIARHETIGYHVSLDMDWVDMAYAPGVGTPVRGGATYREAHLAMELIADDHRLVSFEIVEVNPTIDDHNLTAILAVELAASVLGKKIL